MEENRLNTFYSVRKIPAVYKSEEKIKDDDTDKIKILELSNLIDKWEQELLFADNGFFSLKGTEVENKSKEFLTELENFINSKISEISFATPQARETALRIKKDKTSAIKREMERYEQTQLKNHEIEVCEEALSCSISRAVLYKNNPDITASSLKNGLTVLRVMAEKEKWNGKTLKKKTETYKSDFYSALINSFVCDKNINAYIYFNRYKDLLNIEDKEKTEKSVNELKRNIIAYNWAKELFSYKLDETEQAKELKNIKDSEVEKLAGKYLNDFIQAEKKQKENEEKEKNRKNWAEIIKITQEDADMAYLYTDYKTGGIKSKREYIKQMKKNGYKKTDKEIFLKLTEEFFADYEKFKQKDISDYQSCLSNEDYKLFADFQNIKSTDFDRLDFDRKYAQNKLKTANITDNERKYDFIKQFIASKEEYKSINKKDADIEQRGKIIDLIIERLIVKTEEK